MERNQAVLLALAGAGLLAAVAVGVVMSGTADPETPEPVAIEGAEEAEAEAPAAADHAPKTAREVPEAPEKVAPSDYVTTESGLQYADIVVGEGESPETGSVVVVEYSGWLENGKLFDSSYKRHDSFKFALGKGNVIKGWDEGVAGMKVGGKRQLRIPSQLGYGERGAPPVIPPNATLVFDVELLEVQPPRVAPEAPTELPDSAYTVTESGLKYHDFEVGTGPAPKKGDLVKVDYTGWLVDGTKFDSSLDRADPIKFPLSTGRVVKGWDEGIASMKEGGRRQLVIPPDLAYGERGRPPTIPPDSTLIFEVHLVDVP